MNLALIPVLALMAVLPPVRGTAGSTNLLAEGITLFRAGDRAWDLATLTNAAARFGQAAAANPDLEAVHYWKGTALFHAVLQYMSDPDDPASDRGATGLMHEAVHALEQAVKRDPGDAESHALLSTLTGMLIGTSPLSAVWRGRRVMRHRELALRTAPHNPRIHYLIGASQYYAPRLVGSRDRGLASFRQAAELFAAEQQATPGPFEPRWGHDHCLAFIGRIFRDRDDPANAARYFRAALALNPGHRLALEGLASCDERPPPAPTP